jgi:hypothetical protein
MNLVKHGLTPHGIAALKAWATRRAKHGARGLSAEGLQRVRESVKRTHATMTARRLCKRGHRYPIGRRECRACRQINEGRKRWARRVLRPRLAKLKSAMLNAHPDKGGSMGRFHLARQRYLSALKKAA